MPTEKRPANAPPPGTYPWPADVDPKWNLVPGDLVTPHPLVDKLAVVIVTLIVIPCFIAGAVAVLAVPVVGAAYVLGALDPWPEEPCCDYSENYEAGYEYERAKKAYDACIDSHGSLRHYPVATSDCRDLDPGP